MTTIFSVLSCRMYTYWNLDWKKNDERALSLKKHIILNLHSTSRISQISYETSIGNFCWKTQSGINICKKGKFFYKTQSIYLFICCTYIGLQFALFTFRSTIYFFILFAFLFYDPSCTLIILFYHGEAFLSVLVFTFELFIIIISQSSVQ